MTYVPPCDAIDADASARYRSAVDSSNTSTSEITYTAIDQVWPGPQPTHSHARRARRAGGTQTPGHAGGRMSVVLVAAARDASAPPPVR
jgi:hypothetical protein